MRRLAFLLFSLLCSNALVAQAQSDKILELGKTTFVSCVACHGSDGKGIKAGDLLMAPSLHESRFVKEDNVEQLSAIILKGILKEDNKYVQAMLPLEAALNDEQIAALISYVTSEFGGKRRSPTANDVAKWRKDYADQKSPYKRSQLEEMLKPQLLTDLKYSLYLGKWEALPDFSKLEPKETGTLKDGKISLDPSRKYKEGFGMVFEGKLSLSDSDEYKFALTSDDGSALAVNGETVAGNDGIHPAKTVTMKEKLEKGEHTIKVLYFDGGGQRSLSLSIQGKKLGTAWLSKKQSGSKGKGKNYDPILLTSQNPGEAIVHRAFLPDTNPRAIGVGYPGAVNVIWDADTLNLAYVYRGEFMDAASHWNGRGSGSKPLGQDKIKPAPGLSLQILESLDEPWVPSSEGKVNYERDKADPQKEITFIVNHPDYQFRGYRLDKKRFPTFSYDYRDLTVTDQFTPQEIDGVSSVSRSLTFEGKADDNLYFRIAALGPLTEENGWYDMGSMNIRVGGVEPVIRLMNGQKELLIPVTDTEAVTVDYRWDQPLNP